jgi:hypothetical protein
VQTADGNIALTQAKWNATGTDPDGKPVTVSEAGQSVLRVRIHPAPPSSPSVFVLLGESIEIRACARDLRLRTDPESGSGRR